MEIRSVSKAVRLLEELAKESGAFGVVELARMLEMDKSSVFRMLRTLENAGFVSQDADSQQYALGMGLVRLGQRALRRMSLRDLARPAIERLAEATGECSHLAILARNVALYVEQATPPHGLGIQAPIGTLAPLHCTALGKILLAFQPAERRESLIAEIPLEGFTHPTIANRDHLVIHLDDVRKASIAFDDEEFSLGVRCIAAPVFTQDGSVCAAIGISGPSPRMTEEKIETWGELIRHEAAEFSKRLGFRYEDPDTANIA